MPDEDRIGTERKIVSAIEDARDTMDAFHFERMRAAALGENPYEDADVVDARVDVHVAVMRAFRRFRPQIREHLDPEFWREVVLYQSRDGEVMVRGFKSLERLRDPVVIRENTVSKTHGEDETVSEWGVELPGNARMEFYERTIDLMGDAALYLGYVEAPDPPKTVYDVNDGGDEGLPEGVPPSDRAQETTADEDAADEGAVATDGGETA